MGGGGGGGGLSRGGGGGGWVENDVKHKGGGGGWVGGAESKTTLNIINQSISNKTLSNLSTFIQRILRQ